MASPPWKVEIFVSSAPPRDEGPDQGHPVFAVHETKNGEGGKDGEKKISENFQWSPTLLVGSFKNSYLVFFLCLFYFRKKSFWNWFDLVCCRVVGMELKLFRMRTNSPWRHFDPPLPLQGLRTNCHSTLTLCTPRGGWLVFKKSFHPQFHLQDLEEMGLFGSFVCVLMRLRKGFFVVAKRKCWDGGKEYRRLLSIPSFFSENPFLLT